MNQNWLKKISPRYPHPSVVLWRSIELKVIESVLKKNKVKLLHPILDLGCGEGHIARAVFQNTKIDCGLDNWPEMVESAKKSGVYRKVVLGDACKLPFKDKSFQTVFSNCVIEHISGIDLVLSEIARVLKKQGLFIFTVPTDNFRKNLFLYNVFMRLNLKTLANKYSDFRNKQLNHFNCFNLEDWKKKLNMRGLSVIHHQYYITPKTTFFWDLMALIYFPFSKISIYPFKELLEKSIIKKLYEEPENNKMSSSLLVIAQKN